MNWQAIGAIGEILGAVAVVVTLVYLARQVKISILEVCDSDFLRTHFFKESWPVYRPEVSGVFATFLESHLGLPTPVAEGE